MTLYLATPPEVTPPEGFVPARMIYRVRGARLYRARGSKNARGGAVVVNAADFTGGVPMTALVEEIYAECEARAVRGVVLDTGTAAAPLQILLANQLTDALRDCGATLFVPEPLGASVPDAGVLIQTALSGGSLRRHLESAVSAFGAARIALEADRIRMDFALPAYSGVGAGITAEQLESLRGGRRTFFSESLRANYFTYADARARHIVLFDDGASLRSKFALARELGIARAFLYYPHVADLLDELRGE